MLVRIGVVALAGLLGVLGSTLVTRKSMAAIGLSDSSTTTTVGSTTAGTTSDTSTAVSTATVGAPPSPPVGVPLRHGFGHACLTVGGVIVLLPGRRPLVRQRSRERRLAVALRRCRERERDLADPACGPGAGGRSGASHRRKAGRPRRWSAGAGRRLGLCRQGRASSTRPGKRGAYGAGRAPARATRRPADRSDRRGRLLGDDAQTGVGGAPPGHAGAPEPADGSPRSGTETGDRRSPAHARETPPRTQPSRRAAAPSGAAAACTPAAESHTAARPIAVRLPGRRERLLRRQLRRGPERRLLASRRRHLRTARDAGRRCRGRDPEPGWLGAAGRVAPLGARSACQRVLLRAPLRLHGDRASRNARQSGSGAR